MHFKNVLVLDFNKIITWGKWEKNSKSKYYKKLKLMCEQKMLETHAVSPFHGLEIKKEPIPREIA